MRCSNNNSFMVGIVSLLLVALANAATGVPLHTATKRLHSPALQRHLLKHAIPVDANGNRRRKLDQNNDEDFELSGAHTIQFHKCAAVSAQPEDDSLLFGDNFIAYTSDGSIAAQKSFILFNVCNTKYCDYYSGDENLFMVDVATYMNAIAVYYQERTERYCEACLDSQNYCAWIEYQKKNGNQDNWNAYQAANQNQNGDYDYDAEEEAAADGDDQVEEEEQQQQQQAEDDGQNERFLMNYRNYKVVDCDTCETMGCWDEAEDAPEFDDDYAEQVWAYEQKASMEEVGEWVQSISECPQTNFDFLNDGTYQYPLYSGFMCNQDGTGVEIALFLDEACTIYDGVHSYYSMLNGDESQTDAEYLERASDMIMYPFLNEIDCNGNLQYVSLQEYRNYAQNYQYENNNEDDGGDMELSEYCQTLFEGGENGEAISLNDCNADGEQDEAEEDQDQVEEYADYYDSYMYTYVLSYENSMDAEATCKVLRALDGEYEMIYKWSSSGQLFDYGTTDSKKSNHGSQGGVRKWLSQYDKMDITLVAAIIVGVLFSLLALGCVLFSCFSTSSVPNKYAMHRRTLDAHRERLVDPKTGELM